MTPVLSRVSEEGERAVRIFSKSHGIKFGVTNTGYALVFANCGRIHHGKRATTTSIRHCGNRIVRWILCVGLHCTRSRHQHLMKRRHKCI